MSPLSTAGATADADASSVARPYDFRRPTKLSREHVRVLEMASETLGRQWTTLLTTTLRAVSTATVTSVDQASYDEFISTLDTETALFVLALDPIPGIGMMEISQHTAMSMVDHLLGGPGSPNQPQRPFTEIESTLLTGIVDRVLAEMAYAFETIIPLEATVAGIEQNPQFAQVASPSDSFLVLRFDLAIGDDTCVASLALPFTDILNQVEKHLAAGAAGRDRVDREAAYHAVRTRVSDADVEVALVVGPTLVRLSDLLAMSVGDVIQLRHPVSQPLALTTAGVTFAYAVPGREGTRSAGLVVHSPEVTA